MPTVSVGSRCPYRISIAKLRERFNDPDGRWMTVGDQVQVLRLVDAIEAAHSVVRRASDTDAWLHAMDHMRRRLARFDFGDDA